LAAADGREGKKNCGSLARSCSQVGMLPGHVLAIHVDDRLAAGSWCLLRCRAVSGIIKGGKVLCRQLSEMLGLALGHGLFPAVVTIVTTTSAIEGMKALNA
jgi:hypothetical protein